MAKGKMLIVIHHCDIASAPRILAHLLDLDLITYVFTNMVFMAEDGRRERERERERGLSHATAWINMVQAPEPTSNNYENNLHVNISLRPRDTSLVQTNHREGVIHAVSPILRYLSIEIDTKLPIVGDQKWVIWICSFNVPMAPGKTRSIVCSARNFFQFSMPGPAWWQVVPRWYEHWTSNKVYDGDMIVLQGQEKVFLSKSTEGSTDVNKEYTKLTFTPTQADRFVLAFRNWLRRHGNSQPEWFGTPNQQALPSTILSKRQMLDRYEQHTLKCSSCKKGHERFQALQKVIIGVAVLCSATAGVPPDMQSRVILAGLAILSAGLAYSLHQLEKNFVFVDYVHAEID